MSARVHRQLAKRTDIDFLDTSTFNIDPFEEVIEGVLILLLLYILDKTIAEWMLVEFHRVASYVLPGCRKVFSTFAYDILDKTIAE